MTCSDYLFSQMAADVGIERIEDETDEEFCRRAAYTGTRYWISAFCLDDGANGTEGLSKQTLNARLKTWIERLDHACPGIGTWFELNQRGISGIYNRLIDVGELEPNGFSGRYCAHPQRLLQVTDTAALVVGTSYCGDTLGDKGNCRMGDAVASGISAVISSEGAATSRPAPWWEIEWNHLPWMCASKLPSVEYARPSARGWSLRKAEVWTCEFRPVNGMGLARTNADPANNEYYAARLAGGRIYLSLIDSCRAYELYYGLRTMAGCPVTSSFSKVDHHHIRVQMPLNFLPGERRRILEVMGWPKESVSDFSNKLFRIECLPLIEKMLSECNVVLKEARSV